VRAAPAIWALPAAQGTTARTLPRCLSHAAIASDNNRVFCTDALFIRTESAVGARSAQWPRVDIDRRPGILRAQALELARTVARPRGSPIVCGPKAVRTQSAILDKSKPKPYLLSIVTLF